MQFIKITIAVFLVISGLIAILGLIIWMLSAIYFLMFNAVGMVIMAFMAILILSVVVAWSLTAGGKNEKS